MSKRFLMTTAIAGVMMAGSASAQTAYTDKAQFQAAAGLSQTENFQGARTGNFASTGGVFDATFDGFSVTGVNNGNFVGIANGPTARSGNSLSQNTSIPTNFYDGTGTNKYLSWANITGGIVSLTINFNAATTAFGFDWFNTDTTDSYNVAVAGGPNFNSPPFNFAAGGTAASGFFGLVSPTAFTSIVITNKARGGYISDEGMDNFITNGAGSVVGPVVASVPEPATWGMMLLGMGGIGYAMRRRQGVAARVSYAV